MSVFNGLFKLGTLIFHAVAVVLQSRLSLPACTGMIISHYENSLAPQQ